MKGIDVKKKLQSNGFSLKSVADLMGETPQNLNSMLNAQDIKTGVVERIADAVKKPLYFFYSENVALMSEEEMRQWDDDMCKVDKPPTAPAAVPPTITPEQTQAVAVLKEIISEQTVAISSLNQDVGELKCSNKYMSQKIKDLSFENERLKSENAGLKNEVESLKKAEYERKHAMAEPKGNDMQVYDVPTQPYTALLAAAEPHVDYHRQRPDTK